MIPAVKRLAVGEVVALYRPSLDGAITGPHKRLVLQDRGSLVTFVGSVSVRRGARTRIEPWCAKHDEELAMVRREAAR